MYTHSKFLEDWNRYREVTWNHINIDAIETECTQSSMIRRIQHNSDPWLMRTTENHMFCIGKAKLGSRVLYRVSQCDEASFRIDWANNKLIFQQWMRHIFVYCNFMEQIERDFSDNIHFSHFWNEFPYVSCILGHFSMLKPTNFCQIPPVHFPQRECQLWDRTDISAHMSISPHNWLLRWGKYTGVCRKPMQYYRRI